MINVHNTFDPLKEIIIGDVDINAVGFAPPKEQPRVRYIFEKTKDELNHFQSILEKLNIKVYRPAMIPNGPVQTPYWSMPGTRIPLTPRDLYLVLGDTIIETAMCEHERFFETFYFRELILEKFKQGAKWISMPMPRHDYKNYEVTDTDVPNQDPIMDAPSCMKYGKDVFVSTRGAGNPLGHEWLKSTFGENYTFHRIEQENITGHLDAQLTILRPGLLMSHHKRTMLPKYFHDWDLINVDPEHDQKISQSQTLIDTKIQDSDFQNTVLSLNCLSLDRNTIVMWDYYKTQHQLIKQLEAKNFDIIFVPFTYCHFFNQGVTCVTLELVRETPEGLIKY